MKDRKKETKKGRKKERRKEGRKTERTKQRKKERKKQTHKQRKEHTIIKEAKKSNIHRPLHCPARMTSLYVTSRKCKKIR